MTLPFCQFRNLRQNQLLAALFDDDRDRLGPDLDLVHLTKGQVLCESASRPTHMYFPTTSIVSLLHVASSGETSEIAVVGNEGAVGLTLFTGGLAAPEQIKVVSSGESYRMRAVVARAEINRGGAVLNMLFNYTQTLMAQMTQTAIYIRHRSVEQQMCRRLLLALDRLPSDEMEMTHEVLADLLGVRRESVTNVAVKLQQAGVIRYTRGHIAVLDREMLEQRASNTAVHTAKPTAHVVRTGCPVQVMQCAA